MEGGLNLVLISIVLGLVIVLIVFWVLKLMKLREAKKYERGLKMMPLLIHLPPTTDDVEKGGRDERDVINETVSQAQVMYSILSSTIKKDVKNKLYGQRHFTFEIIAKDGVIRYYAVVPAVLTETVKQAVQTAYPKIGRAHV